ncbi:MAG: hypothetical protein JWR77_151 [Rhizorhabdus sp.]|nr:hypothetical protein [Rhizorhabdus sp.]
MPDDGGFAGRIGHWFHALTGVEAGRQDIIDLLALLRDPTDMMTEAGADHVDRIGRVAVDGVWSAMIDGALAEAGAKGITRIAAVERPVADGHEGVSMSNLEIYRANAAAQRAAADLTNLPNRRAMHERSAQSWEAMAANAADTIERAGVNEAAKARTADGSSN